MTKLILDDIKLFIEIARTGSFKRAALALEIPPATLSRRIADLETRIGLQLLNRSTRSVQLTDSGAAYLEQCGPLVDAMLGAHAEISRAASSPSGTLRLTCTPDFAAFYLPPVIKRYTADHPDVTVELSLGSHIEDLNSQHFDLAIRMGPLPASLLIGRQIATLIPILCASATYLKTAPAIHTPEDLQHHACIRINAAQSSKVWRLSHPTQGAMDIATDTHNSRLIAGSPYMSLALTLEDLGVALLDPRVSEPYLTSGRLRRLLPDWSPAGVAVNVLTPSRLAPSRVRVFVDYLQESLV